MNAWEDQERFHRTEPRCKPIWPGLLLLSMIVLLTVLFVRAL